MPHPASSDSPDSEDPPFPDVPQGPSAFSRPDPSEGTSLEALLTGAWAYEQEPQFQASLAEVARTGIAWVGWTCLLGIALYIGTYVGLLGFDLTWTYVPANAEPHIALPTVLVAVLGATALVTLRNSGTLRQCRAAAAGATLAIGAVAFYDGALEGEMVTDAIVLLYLLAVAAVPFRPLQVLGLGAGLTALAGAVGWAVPFPTAGAQVGFLVTATAVATGVGAGLYRRHRVRVDSELALKRGQEALRATERVAKVGGWEVAPDTKAVTWTPEVRSLLEVGSDRTLDVEEALGFFPGPAEDKVRRAAVRCLKAGTPFDLELPLVTATGNRRWVRVRGKAEGDGPPPYRAYGAVQDITDRKQAEVKLKKRERQLRAITENVSEGIYRSTPSGELVYANQAFADIFGFDSPESMLDLSTPSLYTDPEARADIIDQVHASGEVRGVEVELRRRDGEVFSGLLTTTLVRDKDGEPAFYDGVVVDVTRQKRRERQLREAKQRAERSRREAERQRRRAEEASRSKSQFLAGIAHDLKSPVSVIKSYADLLMQNPQGEGSGHAGKIWQAAEQIEEMSTSLTEMSRLERGSISLETRPVDLPALLGRVAEQKAEKARTAGIDLSVEATKGLQAAANAESLRRAVVNLVENALSYAGDGDRVVLRAFRAGDEEGAEGDSSSATGGSRAAIVVEDTGPGIDPDFIDDLFEPFARNAPDTEGTGLGLAVTKELVEAMGGSIDVESTPGEGTRFRISLPGAQEPSAARRKVS
jgi:PAS domain S-box-containing protein